MIAGFIRNQGFLLAALGITAAVMLGIYLDCIWIPLTLFGLLVTSIGFLYPSYLFYLVIASIPFSFEYSISETFGTDLPDELFMLVMVGAALLGMALHYHRRLEQLVKHPIFLLLILQYTWSVVSCVHSQHVLLSTKYVVSKIWYIIPFVVVPQWVLHQKKKLAHVGLCNGSSYTHHCSYGHTKT
jgi:O-antigen ligase